MELTTDYVDIPTPTRPMRCLVVRPDNTASYPGVLFYTDIFQLTDASIRWAKRLASYGAVVIVPEIYYRIEPAGTVLAFDTAGKERGLADMQAISVAELDEDIRCAVDYAASRVDVDVDRIGVTGHCAGGHIAFRAGFDSRVRSTVCWYPTGLHNGQLCADADTGSLNRAADISGKLIVMFGDRDPHTPADSLVTVRAGLESSGVDYDWHTFDAAHAFGRDIGDRWNPAATDRAMAITVAALTDAPLA